MLAYLSVRFLGACAKATYGLGLNIRFRCELGLMLDSSILLHVRSHGRHSLSRLREDKGNVLGRSDCLRYLQSVRFLAGGGSAAVLGEASEAAETIYKNYLYLEDSCRHPNLDRNLVVLAS